MSTFLIKYYVWDNKENNYQGGQDCVLMLNTDGKFEISKMDEPVIMVKANILKDNIALISRNKHKNNRHDNIVIDYEMYYDDIKFGFRFDARSSAAEVKFRNEYDNIIHKIQTIQKYKSERIHIEGHQVNGNFEGMCIEHYDKSKSPIKYIGEFEDGLYDGHGEFYSKCGNIKLTCNNICSGKPNGKGLLIVGKKSYELNMEDYKHCEIDDDYLVNIYAELDINYKLRLEELTFNQKDLNDKLLYLLREIQKIKYKDNSNSSIDKLSNRLMNMF